MSSLLPVLRSEIPAMTMCAVCPKPGHCCHNLMLSEDGEDIVYKNGTPFEEIAAKLRAENLPFEPLAVFEDHGETFSCTYKCRNLLPNGLCGDYLKRPQLCRDYAPLDDELCIFSSADKDEA